MRIALALLACLGAISRPAVAHEFWLSPQEYQLPIDGQIVAELRVGQNFKGSGYPYLPRDTARFEMITQQGATPLTPRMGDRPALSTPAETAGLTILVHETTDKRAFYQKPEKFLSFVEHKDLGTVVAENPSLFHPETPFSESYRRYAKSLVAVGDGHGADRDVGLRTEIIALKNPYTDDPSHGLPVQVMYQGTPRADAQIEVFEKMSSGTVRVFTLRTDARGQATVPVLPGRSYLLDAVVLRPTGNTDPDAGPLWHSLWASLTFAVPG